MCIRDSYNYTKDRYDDWVRCKSQKELWEIKNVNSNLIDYLSDERKDLRSSSISERKATAVRI